MVQITKWSNSKREIWTQKPGWSSRQMLELVCCRNATGWGWVTDIEVTCFKKRGHWIEGRTSVQWTFDLDIKRVNWKIKFPKRDNILWKESCWRQEAKSNASRLVHLLVAQPIGMARTQKPNMWVPCSFELKVEGLSGKRNGFSGRGLTHGKMERVNSPFYIWRLGRKEA